jgi:YgiT-type zinc finger domain-containing protein
MIGEPENDRCYFCDGKLRLGLATLPFVLGASVMVVKDVPAEICMQCGEAMMSSQVAAKVDALLKQAQHAGFEVSIMAYAPPALVPA